MSDNERDELALDVLWGKEFPIGARDFIRLDANAAHAISKAIREAGYVKAEHTEYALDHKRADLQFTDDDGELWTDEDDVKDYASEYGDTGPLVKRHVTAWEAAQ